MNKLKITLKKSLIGINRNQIRNVYSLGLKKINQEIFAEDNGIIRGILKKINHLVLIEKIVISERD
ncbi:50S ribosomal protein L30 [Candidatus Phytoplasma sacchari]|uniref:50S ribosomal protein L30 n=1 Tax=Candidatus Phytoplasma sacchari TaxID=2609813 RepID=A0ABY7M2Z7_9MOLU|nr:50S ribosomal protein L30 [Candidatus Phytoplasma sacchari]